jgi:lipopolysaccharide/colanic/teichoic acid biosynthesis glycosyltransferase
MSSRYQEVVIRSIDLLVASVLFVIFFFPMIIIAGLILLEDGTPVLFKQTRVGRNKKVFVIFKFRSMRTDLKRATGEISNRDSLLSDREAFVTTSENDIRVTKVGKLIRPAHLDELPQLINVLSGSMSLVGVRPDVPVQVADYSEQEWALRHKYRPGLTGLAQVSNCVDSMAQRTKLDLEWVNNRSVSLYCKVIIKTISKVLSRSSF